MSVTFIPKIVTAQQQPSTSDSSLRYKLQGIDDTTMLGSYIEKNDKNNGSHYNISEIPGGTDLSLDPNNIEGKKVSEEKNSDGSYTITYETQNGKTTVTGKKSGLLSAFGIGKINKDDYTISEYDKNGMLTSTTKRLPAERALETTLYDEDGNKDFAVKISGLDVNIEYVLEHGVLACDQSLTLTDYNSNGTYFTETISSPKKNLLFSGVATSSTYSQTFFNQNGEEITFEEYMEMNNNFQ